MKKLLLFAGIVLITASGLQAATRDSIEAELVGRINELNMKALDSGFSISEQQKVVTRWDEAVANAKKFVIDNSKDLLRREDTTLMSALSKIQAINNDFTNTIKVIRGSLPNAPISKLLKISADAKKFSDEQASKSFTLSGKKDANYILMSIGTRIYFSAKILYDSLVAKK